MTTTATTHQLLGISEIADLLVPALRETEAEQAFLCGPYVRAARNGDIRRYDELHMLIIADVPGTSLEQARHFSPNFRFARDHGVFLTLEVYEPRFAERRGSPEKLVKAHFDDWEKIYDIRENAPSLQHVAGCKQNE